jgi:hypothetical protein
LLSQNTSSSSDFCAFFFFLWSWIAYFSVC